MADYPLLSKIQTPADLKSLSVDQLPDLAGEIRQAICDQVSQTGGHLAPNLGVVELTVALHYVFDFGHDRMLFDVGHQCYPHKLLTGRLPLLSKLRQKGGMAGFPEPHESAYDLFSVGHAGTGVSTAVGMARGDDMQAKLAGQAATDRRVVTMVGDASIVNGVAMEGLNSAGTLKRQFLVVLNDNGMSIAKPQGAIAQYFDRMRVDPMYGQIKRRVMEIFKRLPYGDTLEDLYYRAGEMMKAAIVDGHMFEQFGLLCVGPIDGHDIPSLIDMLNEVRDFERPILLHVKTVKGKGFDFSTSDPTTFHSPKPFKVEGCRVEIKSSGRSFTSAYADQMIELMNEDEKIVAVTAAMPDGTGLSKVAKAHPDRVLDTGICESHAMDMCAGMAKSGLRPFFAVYSTFSQRALDQAFQEVSLQGLPVRVCMDRGGLVGGDGAVHHGFMDISMFRTLPEAVLMAASDEANLKAALRLMKDYDQAATFLRYPRDNVAATPLQDHVPPFEPGKANLVRPPRAESGRPDLVILAYGVMVYQANDAINQLAAQGYDVALYDARFAKPLDRDLIRKVVSAGVPMMTIEDHGLSGGFGAAVLEACNEMGLPTDRIRRLGLPDRWIYQNSRAGQLEEVGLDFKSIAASVQQMLSEQPEDRASDAVRPEIHVRAGTRPDQVHASH